MWTNVFRAAALVTGLVLAVPASAADAPYRRVVDGVAVYFGILPAELVRGHPPQHPEGTMHGGAPAGENHVTVALFEDQSGWRSPAPQTAWTC